MPILIFARRFVGDRNDVPVGNFLLGWNGQIPFGFGLDEGGRGVPFGLFFEEGM